jgi:[lysine-biosynthesis-protein LysW]--L-2-aminoadipate ligase
MKEIGLIYDRIRWEEKSLLNTSKKIKKDFGEIIIQRCISYFRGLHLTALLENFGIKVINPLNVSLMCGNKLFTSLALVKAGVPTPKTLVAFTNDGATKALTNLGYPAVLKPVIGSWGRLIALIRDKESAQAIIESRKEMQNALLQIYYIQEYVERPPRDIRVLVIGDEAVAASYRYSSKGDWRTNVSRGGTCKPCPLTKELEDLAIKAVEALGTGVLAVDCMESPEGILVHEVNNTVEFRGLCSTTNVNIPKKIIDYVTGMTKK